MKQSEFYKIGKHENFKAGFRGALSRIIAEIVDSNTKKDESGNYTVDKNTIDQWEFKRREWAYSMKGQNGNVDRFIDDLRPLFPIDESTPYAPFTLNTTMDPQWPDGIPDVDEVETVLYQRIKYTGMVNYWVGNRPEDKGKMFINGVWSIPVVE